MGKRGPEQTVETPPGPPMSRRAPPSRLGVLAAAAVIILAGVVAYGNSFSGPFILDDIPGILENATLRSPWTALVPPRGTTVEGRPVVNLSLAINYALGGKEVRGYHIGNLAIHLAAALALFGLVRRTLLLYAAGGMPRPPLPGHATAGNDCDGIVVQSSAIVRR